MSFGHIFHDHAPALVALSIAIAVLASYAALDLAARIRAATGMTRRAWLTSAALAMGGGIWSMHFIAMLALESEGPIEFDIGLTLLSLVVAILVTGCGFWFMQRKAADVSDLVAGGALMGLGIAAMHYTGMAAVRVPGRILYDPALVAASVAIAIAAATAALVLASRDQVLIKRAISAGVMGAAIAGMHFTGMAAADIVAPGELMDIPGGEHGVSRQLLAILVAFAAIALLALALASSFIDQRFAAGARREQELREATLRAEYASRAKSEFLAMMSHELRTPLNAIIGFAEVMQDELFGRLGNDRYQAYVRDIHSAGAHLLTIINDMLDLSKAEAGRIELKEVPVDVAAAIRRCLTIMRGRADNAGVSLALQVPESLPDLLADELRLKQILLNLLSNAVKFTPQGGRVVVEVLADPASLSIAVRDNGAGIAERDIDRVFTPFVQVGNLYTRKQEGTGLGLPLTKRMVDLHDGRLEIVSAVGQGTTVTARFPRERLLTSERTAVAVGRAVA
jgi:signal transduction histidine kinase